jgi:hypothetical protein
MRLAVAAYTLGRMGSFPHAPGSLVVFGITCTVLAGLLSLVLGWHVVRRLLDVPRVPRGPGTYVVMVLACLGLVAAGVIAFVVAAGLEDWPGVPARAPLAEVQCQRQAPAGARLGFVPFNAEGTRGPEEAENVPACDLAIGRLRFAAPFARFGLVDRHRLARVGTRRRPVDAPTWRALPRPLGVPVAAASEQQLAVPADGARYRVIADERGFRLER